jgi:hypothetical protein
LPELPNCDRVTRDLLDALDQANVCNDGDTCQLVGDVLCNGEMQATVAPLSDEVNSALDLFDLADCWGECDPWGEQRAAACIEGRCQVVP